MEFEKAMTRLEEVVNQLESGEKGLEDSLLLYEEGMKLAKECQKKLAKAEQKVYILKNEESDSEKEQLKKKNSKQEDLIKQNFDLFNNNE